MPSALQPKSPFWQAGSHAYGVLGWTGHVQFEKGRVKVVDVYVRVDVDNLVVVMVVVTVDIDVVVVTVVATVLAKVAVKFASMSARAAASKQVAIAEDKRAAAIRSCRS